MKNKSNCFIDFDGTIVCNKVRLYKFFTDHIDLQYKKSLSIEEFWSLKKMGVNEIDWINQQYNSSIDKYKWNEIKRQKIENKEYLTFNNLFKYSIDALSKIKRDYNLILVSRRSNSKNLLEELENNNIKHLFDDILITKHNDKGKSNIIITNYKIGINDIIIGDTEDDIKAALDLNIIGILVMSGIRSEWILNKYFLDYKKIFCFENISQIDFNKIKSLNCKVGENNV